VSSREFVTAASLNRGLHHVRSSLRGKAATRPETPDSQPGWRPPPSATESVRNVGRLPIKTVSRNRGGDADGHPLGLRQERPEEPVPRPARQRLVQRPLGLGGARTPSREGDAAARSGPAPDWLTEREVARRAAAQGRPAAEQEANRKPNSGQRFGGRRAFSLRPLVVKMTGRDVKMCHCRLLTWGMRVVPKGGASSC
jgi:hypothetical protein